jgi:hypothetical protein
MAAHEEGARRHRDAPYGLVSRGGAPSRNEATTGRRRAPLAVRFAGMRLTAAAVLALVALGLGGTAAASAKGPTVDAELRRLQATGTLPAATVAGYRHTAARARATLRRLSGTRRTQLRAVLANLDAIAAARRLSPSRLPALMETVERNRVWWSSRPLPATGQRVTFPGSQIVWQFYPGQGMEIQWLGTFGKANALWQGRVYDAQLRSLLDEALGLASERAGGIAFEYLFRFDGGRPPWVSGLAQGTALSALSRAAVRLRDPRYFDAARRALGIFRTAPPTGVRVATRAGAHYLQYSYAPRLHVVNGFVQALNGLDDFAVLANDAEARALFGAGEAQLRVELPSFDTGAWSLYAKPGGESDLGYHKLLRDFLLGLCQRTTADRRRTAPSTTTPPSTLTPASTATPAPATTTTPPPPVPLAELPDPALYCDTAQRFTADLTTPPTLELLPATLRARRPGRIAYVISRRATVTLTASRAGRVVLRRVARVGFGRHVLRVRPAQSGPLVITARAVDPAGQVATASSSITVGPAPARR